MDPEDVATLTALEESLWRPETRFDPAYLERVLAVDFDEFGASGRHWTRAATIAMAAEELVAVLPLPELRVRALGRDTTLLTYRGTVRAGGELRTALRSSVWQRLDGGWRLRLHQGTPVD